MTIDPMQASVDQGWVVTDGLARHSGCFPGVIPNTSIEVEAGKSYTLEFEVEEYTSGGVYAIVGGVSGTNRTALGVYTQVFAVPANATDLTVKFYSDGTLGVRYMNIYPTVLEGPGALTYGFNARENKFSSSYSFEPDLMVKFIDDFMAFKNGGLWKMNANETRNNFFGVQGTSKVTFICNVDPQSGKLFYNIRLDSVGDWFAPALTTAADDKFPSGMTSRLKKANFKSKDGKLWADILRDMNDPNFDGITPDAARQLAAIFQGRRMQGTYLVVELECADTTEIKLLSADIYYTNVKRDR